MELVSTVLPLAAAAKLSVESLKQQPQQEFTLTTAMPRVKTYITKLLTKDNNYFIKNTTKQGYIRYFEFSLCKTMIDD